QREADRRCCDGIRGRGDRPPRLATRSSPAHPLTGAPDPRPCRHPHHRWGIGVGAWPALRRLESWAVGHAISPRLARSSDEWMVQASLPEDCARQRLVAIDLLPNAPPEQLTLSVEDPHPVVRARLHGL